MTNRIGIYALGFMLVSAAVAGDGRLVKGLDQEDDLLSFIAGSYEVIGRRPESKEIYSGGHLCQTLCLLYRQEYDGSEPRSLVCGYLCEEMIGTNPSGF